jgi:hypothetical protein
VVVRGRPATFVKPWGDGAAIVRFDDAMTDPKVIPLSRILPMDADGALRTTPSISPRLTFRGRTADALD